MGSLCHKRSVVNVEPAKKSLASSKIDEINNKLLILKCCKHLDINQNPEVAEKELNSTNDSFYIVNLEKVIHGKIKESKLWDIEIEKMNQLLREWEKKELANMHGDLLCI